MVHLLLWSQVHNFGDPFLLRVSEADTLADIRPRIQHMLGIADEEFAKWKFAAFFNFRPPDYLKDEDRVVAKLGKTSNMYSSGQESMYLGLEHTDAHPHRNRHHNNRYLALHSLAYAVCLAVTTMIHPAGLSIAGLSCISKFPYASASFPMQQLLRLAG